MDMAPSQNPDNQQVYSEGTQISVSSLAGSDEKPKKGGSHSIAILAGIIVIAVIFLVLYLTGTLSYLIQVSGVIHSSSAFSSVGSTTQLNSVVSSLINSSNAFNISYTGSYLNFSSFSPSGVASPYEEDIVSYVSKYGNAFKAFFSGGGIENTGGTYYLLGSNNNLTFCDAGFNTFECLNYTRVYPISKYLAYNYISWLVGSTINSSDVNELIDPYNLSQFLGKISSKYGRVNYIGEKTYDGNNCSEVSGTTSAEGILGNSTDVKAHRYYNLCFSNSFGLPLEGYVDTTVNVSSVNVSSNGLYDFVNISEDIVSHLENPPKNVSFISSLPKLS